MTVFVRIYVFATVSVRFSYGFRTVFVPADSGCISTKSPSTAPQRATLFLCSDLLRCSDAWFLALRLLDQVPNNCNGCSNVGHATNLSTSKLVKLPHLDLRSETNKRYGDHPARKKLRLEHTTQDNRQCQIYSKPVRK